MSEMRARAAKAVQEWCEANNQCFPLYYEQALLRERRLEANEDAEDDLAEVSDAIGCAALLAALDPEDTQLVADVLRDLEDAEWDEFGNIVRMVIGSLHKQCAQGVTDGR